MRYALFLKKDISLIIILIIWVVVLIGVITATLSTSVSAVNDRIPVYSVENNSDEIALTFNCAWDDTGLDEILTVLEEENVRCTFFFVGAFAEKYPEAVRRIYNCGHEIANHSMNHSDPVEMQFEKIVSDINSCNEVLCSITGFSPGLYRAPSGSYDNKTVEAAESLGMTAVQWDVDSIDWKNLSPEKIISRVTGKATSGSIVLFHLGKENTADALPDIIEKLKNKGFSCCTVSNMLLQGETYIDNEGRLCSK